MEQVRHLTNVDPSYSVIVDILQDWKNSEREEERVKKEVDANHKEKKYVLL